MPKTKNNDNFEFLRAGVRTPIKTEPETRFGIIELAIRSNTMAKNDAFVLLSLVDAFPPMFKLFISPPPLLPPPPPPPPPTPSIPTPPILLSLEANICAELLISTILT
uniref:Uncharacterized protein n=1 Tax=Glossina palpalis gambiensis TaxID=67801 RepID=A0A1B0AY00_9MUSC